LRAGFGGSRSGDGRFGATATRDDVAAASEGVYWTPAHKDSCSRQKGRELLRERLKNVRKPEGPRLLVFNTCRQFIRMVPALATDAS
jgi:hypothetical protein